MSTITSTPTLRAQVFATASGSIATIALVDETWVVTYVSRSTGTHVFTCEDWARDMVQGRLHFHGTREVLGRPVLMTSPAYPVVKEIRA